MAASKNKLDQFNNFIADECCCPICLDEFTEPKSLSKCLHNVCESCLEKMCRSDPYSLTIQCPVCRQVSPLPPGGVSAMPTNKLLVRLMEKVPGRQEKQVIKKALEDTKQRVSEVKQNAEKFESFCTQRDEVEQHLKEEITSTADKLIAKIQQEKKRLLGEVESYFSAYNVKEVLREKEEMIRMQERASKCIEVVEDMLKTGNPAELMEMKDTVLLQLNEFNLYPVAIDVGGVSPDLNFNRNIKLQDLLEEKGIGELQTQLSISSPTFECVGACGGCDDINKRGQLIETLQASDFGISEFYPFAVAVSQTTGDIAILNESKRKVFVLNESGENVCSAQIQYGDLYDVAFSRDGDLIVVNVESSRLLHYGGKNGIFIRKRVEPYGRGIKFKMVSVDVDGRLIVSCDSEEGDEVSVQVYDHNRNYLFGFGEGDLSNVGKAVYHDGDFYVSDGDCVKVFDGNGIYKRQLGDFFDAAGVDIDPVFGNIIVTDRDVNTLFVYNTDGTYLTRWETKNSPTSLALTKSGKIYVTCWEDKCVQCFSYM